MSDKGLVVDNKTHELKLGASFNPNSKVAYHSIRYDFKPASVDTAKEAQLEIGERHHVSLTVPHVEGSGKTHTTYKGNKRPISKECVLVIDHDTGTFTLERLTNNISVKKTRTDTSSRGALPTRPVTPVETKVKSSPNKVKSSQSPPAIVKSSQSPPATYKHPSPPSLAPKVEKESCVLGEISDSSSDSDDLSSDSDSDSDSHVIDSAAVKPPVPMTATVQPPMVARSIPPSVTARSIPPPANSDKRPGFMSMISADLQLSDSDSDSD